MVILVDGAAYSAQGVVAVGQHIGQGELLEPGGPGGLDDAHIGDVVAGHGVHLQLEGILAAGGVVAGQDAVGHGFRPAGSSVGLRCGTEGAVFIDDAVVGDFDHAFTPSFLGFYERQGGFALLFENIAYFIMFSGVIQVRRAWRSSLFLAGKAGRGGIFSRRHLVLWGQRQSGAASEASSALGWGGRPYYGNFKEE